MFLMKSKVWFLVSASSLAVLWFVFICSNTSTQLKPEQASSAFNALQQWGTSRFYSGGKSADRGFYQAWEQKRATPSARQLNKAASQWEALGPENLGARTLALAVDPLDAQLVYAGSASGGLWRSRSGGLGESPWERIETGYPVLGVAAIAIRPDKGEEIYIGTGEVYGYQNATLGIGERVTRGSYGIGILKSTDGGESWRPALDWRYHEQRGVMHIVFDPNDYQIVWAATTEGVYRSGDGGVTWVRKLDEVMATNLIIHKHNPQIMLAACGGLLSPGHGIYRSVDGGESWHQLTENFPATFRGKAMLDMSPADPDVMYVSIGNGYDLGLILDRGEESGTWLMRSEDAGAHFEVVNTEDYASFQGWYSHVVRSHPQDPQNLLVAGVFFKNSRNGGRILFDFENGSANITDTHAITFAPSDPNVVYVGFDQGIAKSDDGGNSFELINKGYVTAQFYRGMAQSLTDRSVIYGNPQDNAGIRYSGDRNWEALGGCEACYFSLDPENSDLVLAMGPLARVLWLGLPTQPGQIVPAQTGWTERGRRANFNAPLVRAASDPEVLYAGADVVFRTGDRAGSWAATNGGLPLDGNPVLSLAVSPHDENLLYAGTAPRFGPMHLFRSENGGGDWVDITAGLPDGFPTSITIDPRDDRRVYVSFSGFGIAHVFVSEDAGQSWRDIDRGLLPDVPTSVLTLDPDYPDHLYVGNDLGVFVSLNRGRTWFSFSEGLPTAVIAVDLQAFQPDRLLRLATHGNGLYERPLLDPDPDVYDETSLLYPWISNREGNFESVLIANNLSALPVIASLTATRGDGSSETVTRRIEAKGFLAESAASLFTGIGSGPGYSVRLTAPSRHIRGRWVTHSLKAGSGASPSQGVAVVIPTADDPADERVGEEIVFGYLPIGSDFLSAPVIVNLSGASADVNLQFFDHEGNLKGSVDVTALEPGRPFAETLDVLLPGNEEEVYLIARAGGGLITGVSFIFNKVFFEAAIGNATATDRGTDPSVGKSLIYPWVSNREHVFQSTIVAVNYGDGIQEVRLTARRETGEPETVTRTIPARGFLSEQAADLFPRLGSGAGYAVELQAPNPLIMGEWVTTNLEAESGGSPSQGVAVVREPTAGGFGGRGRTLIFGYLPVTDNAASAPVLVNLGAEPARVALYFYDARGRLLLVDDRTLAETEPLRPFARLVNDLVPGVGENVYMVAVSETEPLTGVAFVFNDRYFEPAIGNADAVEFTP